MPSPLGGLQDLRALKGLDDHRVGPGYAVSVLRNGERVDGVYAGCAHLEHGVPIGPRTRFHVASLAKQFTGFAVALLEAEGALCVDDPASGYLEGYPALDGVRIRHLLHHTSGIRDQWALVHLAGWRSNDVILAADVLSMLKRQRRPQFSPGARFLYSNSGYTLLAAIVERVAGMDFSAFARRRIFEPLGMEDTAFLPDPAAIVADRAEAYSVDRDNPSVFHRYSPNLYVPGSTSLVTTVGDMEKWDRNFHRPLVGSRHLLERVRTPGRRADGQSIAYGYGLFCPNGGEPVAYHTGVDFGFHAYYGQYQDGASVIILSNANPRDLWGLAQAVAHESGAATTLPTRYAASVAVESYCGVYEDRALDNVAVVEVRHDELVLRAGRTAVLEPVGPDRFRYQGSPTLCRFLRDQHGEVAGVRITSPNSEDDLARVAAPAPSDQALSALCGDFWSPELSCLAKIVAGGQGLTLELPKQQVVPLRPVTEDLLLAGTAWMRPVRSDHGRSGFQLSETRARGIEFARVELP